MKAIVLNKISHKLALKEVPMPMIRKDEILVKTLATGICSTDRELIDNNDVKTQDGNDYLIIGHEAVGEIIEPANISDFQKGDIVVATVRKGCGKCDFCNNGRSDFCSTGSFKERGISGLDGFMAEYFAGTAESLLKVPKNLKDKAVLIEPLSVGVKAVEESLRIQKCRLIENFSDANIEEKKIFGKALVIGAGSIGLLNALVLRNAGVDAVFMDIDSEDGLKADIVKMIGAQYIDIKSYLKNNIIDINKLGNNYDLKGIKLMIDASGSSLTCLQLVELLSFNGICVLLSITPANAQIFDFNRAMSSIVFKNQVVLGSVNSNYNHFVEALQHLEQAEKTFNGFLDKIITHKYHFSRYQEAFNVKSTNRIKVVLNWD